MAACFVDIVFRSIIFYELSGISKQISQKYVLKGLIDNKSALIQRMAWRRSGNKPLSKPMMT